MIKLEKKIVKYHDFDDSVIKWICSCYKIDKLFFKRCEKIRIEKVPAAALRKTEKSKKKLRRYTTVLSFTCTLGRHIVNDGIPVVNRRNK